MATAMTTMQHLAAMDWNPDDELQRATTGRERVYFQHSRGIRSRKYPEKQGSTTDERMLRGEATLLRMTETPAGR